MKTPIRERWLIVLLVSATLGLAVAAQHPQVDQLTLGRRSVTVLTVGGLDFKDLNKNGRLDPYEDWRLPVDTRVDDLVRQMTLEEKAGLMVSPTLPMGPNGVVAEGAQSTQGPFGGSNQAGTSEMILTRHIRQFINRVNTTPRTMVTWLNAVQEIAERSRLGIPAFFVSNPRNHLGSAGVLGIDEAGSSFSQWPGSLGLAATRDAALVEEFARIPKGITKEQVGGCSPVRLFRSPAGA
jgi:beta-glucosidase